MLMQNVDETFSFEPEGVVVIVPPQATRISIVKVPPTDIPLEQLPVEEKVFYPFRKVMNFVALDVEELIQCSQVENFNPAITLRVRFTAQDLVVAGSANNLVLGYYLLDDPENPILVVLGSNKEFHFDYDDESNPELGGYGVAHISSWGDPQMTWGTKLPRT